VVGSLRHRPRLSMTGAVSDRVCQRRTTRCSKGARALRSEDEYDRLLGGLSDALAQPVHTGVSELYQRPALPVPDRLDVAAIRRRTGLAQPAFARPIAGPPLPTGPGAAGAGGSQSAHRPGDPGGLTQGCAG
jgi:hypothetical protein